MSLSNGLHTFKTIPLREIWFYPGQDKVRNFSELKI